MSEHDEIISQFVAISGADPDRARFLLESSNYDIQAALEHHYTSDDAPAAPTLNAVNVVDPDDSEDEEDQQYYVGGSTSSGQAVLPPPGAASKKDRANAMVEDLFKQAKESGAETATAGSDAFGAGSSAHFSGGGFKLGDSSADASQRVDAPPEPPKPRTFKMCLYDNGFVVDDGPLRPFDSPESVAFLGAIKRNQIPREILVEARGAEVGMDVEDRRGSDYEPPKGKVAAFTGAGQRLGAAAPAIVTAGPSGGTGDPRQLEIAAQSAVSLAPGAPVTQLQIRLHDGSRVVAKFNPQHTVGDIRRFVITARPQLQTSNFALLTSFPVRELTTEADTIETAKLGGSALSVRMT